MVFANPHLKRLPAGFNAPRTVTEGTCEGTTRACAVRTDHRASTLLRRQSAAAFRGQEHERMSVVLDRFDLSSEQGRYQQLLNRPALFSQFAAALAVILESGSEVTAAQTFASSTRATAASRSPASRTWRALRLTIASVVTSTPEMSRGPKARRLHELSRLGEGIGPGLAHPELGLRHVLGESRVQHRPGMSARGTPPRCLAHLAGALRPDRRTTSCCPRGSP